MFGAFNDRMDAKSKRRLVVSVGVSLVIYAALTATAVAMASKDEKKPEDREVEVTFVRKIEEPPPPPPPPPPKPQIQKAAPGPVAPPAPKPKPKTVKPPPPPPDEVPKNKLEEKEPVKNEPAPPPDEIPTDPTPGPAPGTPTDPNGVDGPGGTGPPGSKGDGGGGGDTPGGSAPVVLPAGATAPVRLTALFTEDDYPRAARAAELEGEVIVKVVVRVDGTVELVKFIKSDPNFDDAVKAILQRLRYKPAVYNGQAIAVFQNLRFPFKIDQ